MDITYHAALAQVESLIDAYFEAYTIYLIVEKGWAVAEAKRVTKEVRSRVF